MFKEYVRRCQENLEEEEPKLSKGAEEFIINFYVDLRKASQMDGNKRSLLVNPRWVHTIVKSSKAAAALRWSDTVHLKDAELGKLDKIFNHFP